MTCQRCQNAKAQYRVYSDIISLAVCEICAEKARQLGITVETMQAAAARDEIKNHLRDWVHLLRA